MKTLFKAGGIVVAWLAVPLVIVVVLFWAPDRKVDDLKARWAPPPSRFVEVMGMQVHVRDEGPRDDAAPLVLLHGTSASLHTWEGWVAQIKGGRRVITLDLPGFGLTGPFPDHDYTMEHYVAFITAFLDRMGVARCVLAGNSFGGNVAWRTAHALPLRIERLVLVDSAGYPLQPTSVPIGFRIARMSGVSRIAQTVLPRRVIDASVRNVYGDPGKVTPELVDRYFELTLREGNRGALGRRLANMPAGDDIARIAALRLPTLILWGGLDRLITPASAQRFHQDIRGSRLVMFENLGHVPQEEDPAATMAALRAFLVQ